MQNFILPVTLCVTLSSVKAKCRIISLDNNNSVKFTSSGGDNSATIDSTVMKIAHAQLHMYTNIMYKFQSSTCKTVGEKLHTKLCPRTDRRTAMAIPVYPLHYVVGVYKTLHVARQERAKRSKGSYI